ncbi:MAG: penicillin-binding protein 1C [Gammaproteobacteria bacterium]|nr:penicillin-binding protein 1C [Gammaproteobacteria bacterium]
MENQRPPNLLLKNKRIIGWNRPNPYTLGRTIYLAGLILVIGVLVDWLRIDSHLPQPDVGGSQRILDRFGREIRHALSIRGERRYLEPLDKIPEQLRNAFVLAEDRHFYTHQGVEWRALARGLYYSLRQWRKVSGGSTITMQLVKINWPELRGVVHKPAQILQALWLEHKYSKGELLTYYLNTVPFGNKISGVGAACRYFFNKTCEQLSPGQVASLAIIPRNPNLFIGRPTALAQRRHDLLQKMFAATDTVVLTQAQSEPIKFTKTNPQFYAAHLTERILEEKPSQSEIFTTIDLELQKTLQALLYAETAKRRGSGDSGAALVLDNDTGEVLAYVGSPDYFDPAHGMVDGIRVLRSPGSALKPFVYELALENNWNLYSIVPDIPMVFSTQRAVYEPNNYGGNFSGPRTIRDALANSKNLPALYMTTQLGETRVLERLRRLGFTSLQQPAEYYGVGLALGNGEVSLWELTQAYSILARLGTTITPTYLRGNIALPKRVMPAETAFLIADVLRDPQARQEEFGRGGPLEFDYDVAVKTGTSSDYRDNWTVGFTKKITVGVWRGNADATPMLQRLSASRGTGPLFHKIMDAANKYRDPQWIKRPAGIVASRVCVLSGEKPGKYCSLTRLEYHLADHAPLQSCRYHKHRLIPNCNGKAVTLTYVQYPQEYQEWAKSSRIPSLQNQFQETCGGTNPQRLLAQLDSHAPSIIEPLNNTLYAIDPTIPLDHQEIRFVLRGVEHNHGVRVFMNDQPTTLVADNDEVFWPLQRGRYTFYLKQGQKVSNAVSILVR